MKQLTSLALVLCLLLSLSAMAEASFDFDATVVCIQPEYVTAAIGGSVASVPVQAGQLIAAGDVVASLSTTKIYAGADGTVTGVFCEPGDSITDIVGHYGALMYIEPDSKYTVSATTDNAYNLSDNKYIHVGEQVYLSCADGSHTGEGFVTTVEGTGYTVEVTSGGFYMGETVSVYRSSNRTAKSRIGRGDIGRIANVAVSGPSEGGSVVFMHVEEGSRVKAGDLLLETLSGEFDARYCTGSDVISTTDGVVASVNVQTGGNVNKGDVVATIYPTGNFQLEAKVNEMDLSALSVGTRVDIRFNWNEDDDDAKLYQGTVSRVLYTPNDAEGGDDTAVYPAYIDFDADESIRLGMTATLRPEGGAAIEDADEYEDDYEDEFDDEFEEAYEDED